MGKAKAVLVLLLLFSSLPGYAQMVTYRKETIFIGNKAYAYLEKNGSAWAREFILKNLAKEDLVQIKPVSKLLADDYDIIYYELFFKGINLKAEMQDDDDFSRILAYEIGKFKILKNDSLDLVAVEAFVQKYPAGQFSKKFSQKAEPLEKPSLKARKKGNNAAGAAKGQVKASPDTLPSQLVNPNTLANPGSKNPESAAVQVQPLTPDAAAEPNLPKAARKSRITLENNVVKKGRKQIGKITTTEKTIEGKVRKIITFQDAKNRKVATVTLAATGGNCQLYTFKDRQTRTLAFPGNQESLPQIAALLVKEGYL